MAQKGLSGKEFFDLIASSDKPEINKVSQAYSDRLAIYLTSVYGAEENIARDCAQEAFEKVYGKIIHDNLDGIEDIFGYMVRTAKNEYLMTIRREKFEVPFEQSHYAGIKGTTGEEVIDGLYSDERKNLLEYCIEQLKKNNRIFFLQVLKYIHEKDADAAKMMNMSHSNYRTKKSRVIESLRDCVKNVESAE
ncbi:MAG: sigma-70 family RNA polymerase sigma factor [Balneolaceae bacterium]|nr:MAG: sigma-70 family RNA polymerase sigma factor [Balneolaceae bacterium]